MEERASARAGLGWGWEGREMEKQATHGRERERALGSSFYMFSSPGPALCKFGSARSAGLPEVLTLVLGPYFDLPLTFHCSIFTGFSLPCLLATSILNSFPLSYLPNIPPSRDGRPILWE